LFLSTLQSYGGFLACHHFILFFFSFRCGNHRYLRQTRESPLIFVAKNKDKDKGQRTKDKVQSTKDKGQRTKDKGEGTKGVVFA
jgi:hypothetical protein